MSSRLCQTLTKLCVNPPNVAEIITVESVRRAHIHLSLRKVVACLVIVAASTPILSFSILPGVILLDLDIPEVVSVLTFLYSLVVSCVCVCSGPF